jgi:hypothetical protein
MLELKTNQLKTRKKVMIDDHEYTVRGLGNIEQINLSQYMRRLTEIAELEKNKGLTEEQKIEGEELNIRISELFLHLFDDGGDQSMSNVLISSLSFEELGMVLTQIFNPSDSKKVEQVDGTKNKANS